MTSDKLRYYFPNASEEELERLQTYSDNINMTVHVPKPFPKNMASCILNADRAKKMCDDISKHAIRNITVSCEPPLHPPSRMIESGVPGIEYVPGTYWVKEDNISFWVCPKCGKQNSGNFCIYCSK